MRSVINENAHLPAKEIAQQALLVIASSLHTTEFPHHAGYDVYGEPATLHTCMKAIRDSALRIDEKDHDKVTLTASIQDALVECGVSFPKDQEFLTWEEIRTIALLSSPNERVVLRSRISQYYANAKVTPLKDHRALYAYKFLVGTALLVRDSDAIANIVLFNELDTFGLSLPPQEFAKLVLLVAKDLKEQPYRIELAPATITEIIAILPRLTYKNEAVTAEIINSVVLEFRKHIHPSLLVKYQS